MRGVYESAGGVMTTDLPRVTDGRTCPKCKEYLPFSAFYGKDGNDPKHRRCKGCERADNQKRRSTSHGRMLARNRMRRYRDNNRDAERDKQRLAYCANPKRQFDYNRLRSGTLQKKARAYLNNELHAGRIVKPERCQRCGLLTSARRLHGHHHDYSKALEVEWLCSLCHGLEHRI